MKPIHRNVVSKEIQIVEMVQTNISRH